MNKKEKFEREALLEAIRSKESIIEVGCMAWINHMFRGMTVSRTQEIESYKAYCSGFIECFSFMTTVTDILTDSECFEMFEKLKSDSDAFIEKVTGKD